MERLWGVWEVLGATWGASWALLEAFWASWRGLGGILGRTWGILEGPWSLLDTYWDPFGESWEALESFFGDLPSNPPLFDLGMVVFIDAWLGKVL